MLILLIPGYLNFEITDLPDLNLLLAEIVNLEEKVANIQKSGEGEMGLLSFLSNFLLDTTFGTCSLLRLKMQIDYTAKRILIPVGGGKFKVDAMVVLPHSKFGPIQTERAKLSRLNLLDRKFQDQEQSSIISERSFGADSFAQELNQDDSLELKSGPVVVMFQPNAQVYEMISYDSQLLDFYTENGVTVVLWNYRGYGESPGKSSMSVSFSALT